jgi:DNA polymerase-3 subunit epsilon
VSVQQRRIRLRDSLQLLVQAEVANRAEQVPLHGILPAESVHGVPERVAAAEILDYIGPAVLVGHHIDFDVRMIEKMIGAHLPGFFLYNRCLDTARLAQQLIYPNRPPAYVRPDEFTLDALIARYGLTEWDRHTAHGDAMIAAELLLHLLDEALARGRNRIGDICV